MKPRDFSETGRVLLNGLARWAEQMLTQAEPASPPKAARRWWIGILLTAVAVGLFEFVSSQFFAFPTRRRCC